MVNGHALLWSKLYGAVLVYTVAPRKRLTFLRFCAIIMSRNGRWYHEYDTACEKRYKTVFSAVRKLFYIRTAEHFTNKRSVEA